MPEQTQKLIHFTDNVLKAASRESEELNRQLENQRNAVLDEAKKTAWENAKAYYNREAAKLRAEAGREVSKHLMEGKRQVYLRRSQVAQEVLAQVRQRVDEFVASPAYSEHLKTLLARAMERLDGVDEIYLRLRPEDLELGPMLAESVAPVKVKYEEGRIQIGLSWVSGWTAPLIPSWRSWAATLRRPSACRCLMTWMRIERRPQDHGTV